MKIKEIEARWRFGIQGSLIEAPKGNLPDSLCLDDA
jgi:hypothetical protein